MRGHGDDGRGDRHRQDEFAQRHAPLTLQHLGVDLEPIAKQDQDERHDRKVLDHRVAGVEVQDLEAAAAEDDAGDDVQRCQRKEAAVRDPGDQGAADEQHPNHENVQVKPVHRG